MADDEMSELFGSAIRSRVLIVLANAQGPLSGYRISRLCQAQPIKVYHELERLARVGVVRTHRTDRARKTWELGDPDLVRFLRRRVRVSWSADWLGQRDSQAQRWARLRERLSRMPPPDWEKFRWRGPPPKTLREFERDPEKDRVLRGLGLRPSVREGRSIQRRRGGER